jgi:hypothetical protein
MREFPAAMTTASRRGPTRALLLTLLGVTAAAAPACKLNQQGVAPPRDRIAFPASALVDPVDGRWLYVANSNSDLRYNNGTLVAVDLDGALADRWIEPGSSFPLCPGADYVRTDTDTFGCCWNFLDRDILDCDERRYIPPASTIEIGSFAAGMQYQSFAEPSCPADPSAPGAVDPTINPATRHDCNAHCPGEPDKGRLLIGVRGNSSLTWTDVGRVPDLDPAVGTRPVFSCMDPIMNPGAVQACQVSVTTPLSSETPLHVPDEPYALALDAQSDLLYVGNLRGDNMHPGTGGISLFDVTRAAPRSPPVFIGPSQPFFNFDVNGLVGVTSLNQRADGNIYASSRYGTNVVNIVPSLDGSCSQSLKDISVVPGADIYTTPLLGAEIRGIQFLPEGNRAFALQRIPPALVGFDISTSPTAFGNFPSDVIETCAAPTFLQSYDAGEGTRLFVTCFDAGQIYVFDPYVPRLISVINAGAGPAGIAFPRTLRPDHALAYIIGFSANNIGVVDLTPGSSTQYHVVQHVGFPSPVPR